MNYVSLPDLKIGLTFDEFRAIDDERPEFELLSIAAYGRPSSPRYAAVWWPGEDVPRRHIEERYDASTPWNPEEQEFGLIPRLVTATGDLTHMGESGVSTTWVFDDVGLDNPITSIPETRVKSSLASLTSETSKRSCESFDVVWYQTPSSASGGREVRIRYLGCFGRKPTAPFGIFETGWVGDTPEGLRGSDIMFIARQGFKRCAQAVPSPTGHKLLRNVFAVMQGDTYERWPKNLNEDFYGGTITDGPLQAHHVEPSMMTWAGAGLFPVHVGANGRGKNVRFCVTYAPARRPKARYFRLVSGTDPGPKQVGLATGGVVSNPWGQPLPPPPYDAATMEELADLKVWAEGNMRSSNIANAQIAIAVDGRLKLLWSLTLGEQGWYATQPSSKFRIGSCSKMLTGMRAAALGSDFLGSTILEALDIDPSQVAGSGNNPAQFQDATVQDFLRMVGGMRLPGDIKLASWKNSTQELPIELGMFKMAVESGMPVPFIQPNTKQQYDNAAFLVIGEALGQWVESNPARYDKAMFDFWPEGMEEHVSIVKPTRQQCINFGEVPPRSPRAIGWNTALKYTDLVAAGFGNISDGYLKVQAGGYDELPDYTGPSGSWCGSAAGFARILQMMHPAEAGPLPSGPRFTLETVLRMGMRPTLENGTKGDWGLGCKSTVSQLPTPNGQMATVRELTKGGTTASGRAQMFHMLVETPAVGQPPAERHSISIVAACNGRAHSRWPSRSRNCARPRSRSSSTEAGTMTLTSFPRWIWANTGILGVALSGCEANPSTASTTGEPPGLVCDLPKDNLRFVKLEVAGGYSKGEMFALLSDGRVVFFSDAFPVLEHFAEETEATQCIKTLEMDGLSCGLSYEDRFVIWNNSALDLPDDPFLGDPTSGPSFVQIGGSAGSVYAIDVQGGLHAMYQSTGSFVPVELSEKVRRLAVEEGACVETIDGNVWCRYPVPTGGYAFGLGPVPLEDFTQLGLGRPATHFVSASEASCFLDEDGVTYCAGENGAGKLGYPSADIEYRGTYEPVPSLPAFERLFAGYSTFCGSTADDEIWCWGSNQPWIFHPQSGDIFPPKPIGTFPGFLDFALGNGITCVLLEDGAVACTQLSNHPLGCPETDVDGWTVIDFDECRSL